MENVHQAVLVLFTGSRYLRKRSILVTNLSTDTATQTCALCSRDALLLRLFAMVPGVVYKVPAETRRSNPVPRVRAISGNLRITERRETR